MPSFSRSRRRPVRSRIRLSSVAPASKARGTSEAWLTYPDASLISMTKVLISVRLARARSSRLLLEEPAVQAFK
jgi:hypothetical protein